MITVRNLNTGTTVTGDTYLITDLENSYRNNRVIFYIDYTKGDETSLDIQLQVKNVDETQDIWYNDHFSDTTPKKITLTQSGQYAIALDYNIVNLARIEVSLTNATAPGTVDIAYAYDNLYQ